MRIVNFGSINIDIFCSVDHIVRPGETIGSSAVRRSIGGKGANQSVAVARAGTHPVHHAGLIGSDGTWIREHLASYGVDTTWIELSSAPTGQAMIQVSCEGENAIVLNPGANKTLSRPWIDRVLDSFAAGDWMMLQNETNELAYLMERAHERRMHICFNPAPYDASLLKLPLDLVDLLVVNEHESAGLSGEKNPEMAMERLTGSWPQTEIIITRGKGGVRYGKGSEIRKSFGSWEVPVIDTTGAGDTFIGCYLANIVKGASVETALYLASVAASVATMRAGAMDAIPTPAECSVLSSYRLRKF